MARVRGRATAVVQWLQSSEIEWMGKRKAERLTRRNLLACYPTGKGARENRKVKTEKEGMA